MSHSRVCNCADGCTVPLGWQQSETTEYPVLEVHLVNEASWWWPFRKRDKHGRQQSEDRPT